MCLQFTKQSQSSSTSPRTAEVTEIVQISSNGMDVSELSINFCVQIQILI